MWGWTAGDLLMGKIWLAMRDVIIAGGILLILLWRGYPKFGDWPDDEIIPVQFEHYFNYDGLLDAKPTHFKAAG
jgi:hypothetical protein